MAGPVDPCGSLWIAPFRCGAQEQCIQLRSAQLAELPQGLGKLQGLEELHLKLGAGASGWKPSHGWMMDGVDG